MVNTQLKRVLKNRHIQMIALGGAIGTGLFLGSASTIVITGPSVILGYIICGFMAFLIMRQLGEMIVEEPVAGSLSYFAYKYWGDYPGFLSGWNYWFLYVLIGITELTAAAAYMTYWFPEIPTFNWAILFFIIINVINMATVKAFGEMEFWFALIKIIAIILMILFGIYLLFFTNNIEGATLSNLWTDPLANKKSAFEGVFPFGLKGFIMAIPIIMFSFGGLELIGVTAAEADNPKVIIPKATNQIIYRILIFYIGTFIILLSLYNWRYLSADRSPFVMIFESIGFRNVAGVLNFIVLTAALSVYNSCVYSNSRMLYGLSLQNNAPKFFKKIDTRGVPIRSICFTALLTFMVVPLNMFVPVWQDAFTLALSIVVAAALINWFTITMAHMKFKSINKDKKTTFPAILYPVGNYMIFLFIIFTISIMYFLLDMQKAIYAGIIWIIITFIMYRIYNKCYKDKEVN